MSQKAQSLQWITSHIPMHALPTLLSTHIQEIPPGHPAVSSYPLFVRTCPATPLHGLLDSVRVDSPDDLEFIYQFLSTQMSEASTLNRTLAIQPYTQSVANIVWSHGIMVIGPGHDGVTTGREPAITVNVPAPAFYDGACRDLGLASAEVEMVVGKDMEVWVTQIRAASGHFAIGPAPVDGIPGFLSQSPLDLGETRIVTIREPSDLSILCSMQSSSENVVVAHPGGSVLSHAAAWCRQKGLSYVVTDLEQHVRSIRSADGMYLHEPSRGWVVCGSCGTRPSKSIDYFKGSYFRGMERSLGQCCFTTLRSWWAAILPHGYYSTGRVITKEVSALAGMFAGVLLRSALIAGMDLGRRLCAAGADRPLWEGMYVPLRFLETHLLNLLDLVECMPPSSWPVYCGSRIGWRRLFASALSLARAFAVRNREETVDAAVATLECARTLGGDAFETAFGDVFTLTNLNPSTEWNRTAQAWAVCLTMLQDLQESYHPDISSFLRSACSGSIT